MFGLLAAGGGRWDGARAGRVGREVDGEDGELARGVGAKPDVVHMFVLVVERRIRPVEEGGGAGQIRPGVATMARARSAHALVTKWLRRAGEG